MDTTYLADGPAHAVNAAAGPMADGAEVVVAIPALNEADHIEACVRSLMNGDGRLKTAEFIVADATSQDGTQAIVQRLAGELARVLQQGEVRRRLREAGSEALFRDGPAFAALVRAERERWATLVVQRGLAPR